MTVVRALLATVFAMMLTVSVSAAGLTGTWMLTLDPDFSGRVDTLRCEFVQDRQTLTADCGDGPVIAGTVKGRAIAFVIMTGQDGLLPARFTGELDDRETGIAGTWTLADISGNRNGRFSAEKVASER